MNDEIEKDNSDTNDDNISVINEVCGVEHMLNVDAPTVDIRKKDKK